MIIEDPESFKIWLTARLEPLCDADPAALAKYVYALVKKDKPVDDLKASMIDQLEVFLQKETHGFVDLLFRTLETQVYDMTPEPPPVVVPSPVGSTIPKGAVTDVDLRETLPTSTDELERKISVKEIEKDERSRRGRRRGSSASLERRPRSRSRSYERRRSRSRERDRARAWRNKSPPPRRYERRRSYSKSPVRRHSRSRTPSNKRGRYRNRSPPRSRSRTRSRTRTRSRSPLDRDRKEIGPNSPPRDSVAHGDTDLRLSNVSQSIQSVVAVPPEIQNYPARRCRDFDEKGYCMRGDLCPFDHGTDPVILEDVGVMYNGSTQQPAPLAPQPHAGHHNVEQLHHPTPPIRPPPPITTNLTEYNPDAPSMEPRMWGRPFRSGPMIRGMVRGGVMSRGGFGPHHQRELINVVTGGGPPYRHPRPHINSNIDPGDQIRMDGGKRGGFDFNRLGTNRMSRNINPPGNSSLQLKKVPPGVNNITHLNNHFSKFGKILNIQVGFEGDPESALITFSTHTEANVAYKSTEAVLNNRFIRVYWYNPNNNNSANNSNNNNNNISNESKQENMPPPPRPSVLERLGAPPSKVLNNLQPSAVIQQEEKVTLVNNNLSKTLYIPSAMNREITPEKKAQIAAEVLKKKEEEDSIKEKKVKQEEARKESIKLNADLRKRKQELLEKQLNQQKLLIQRLETGIHTPDQKAKVMTTIKTLQDSIEKLRKDLATTVKATITKTKGILTKEHLELVKKTREETQRKLLDAELDLYNRQQEGKDTIELKKKVSELKMKAFSLGLSTVTKGATTVRGRGSFRARGRGRGSRFTFSGSYDHNVVDHRPTKLLVSGYEQDDKADVLAHFAQYGEIADYVTDDATPSLILNFKSRKEAEVAIAKGRNFQDRLLSVTWASHSHSLRSGVPTKNHRSVMVVDEGVDEVLEGEDEEEIVSLLSPTALLQDEEDEEEEDRSWRR